jgi:hypothetical protein
MSIYGYVNNGTAGTVSKVNLNGFVVNGAAGSTPLTEASA